MKSIFQTQKIRDAKKHPLIFFDYIIYGIGYLPFATIGLKYPFIQLGFTIHKWT